MTAGNNGTSTPEDDDPFGYLYEDGQTAANGAQARRGGYGYPGPASQPGVPRTSYNQVRTVGERQYGAQVPPQQYGQQPQYGGQQQYGQQAPYGQSPDTQYASPSTGGAGTRAVPAQRGGGGRGSGGGPNTKGLLIGAVAVVAVVVIGITVALMSNNDDGDNAGGTPSGGPTAPETTGPSEDAGSKPEPEQKPIELPKQDAATLKLGSPAVLAKDIKGAKGSGGAYVTGFNAVGASVTWTADIAEAGEYALNVRYAIPAKDANATLTVNGKANTSPLGLKNFINSTDPNWEKNWQTTWAPVNLQKGTNEIKISCEQGNQCDAILDWLEVSPPR
ncbi:carbohydrate-binding protein [Streptomyces sp. NBC_01498]|uniref:CBM35 domain-containing protein n=1 Tax=Streptomyces sp. NBC_01498 TaxID=2975870 RepID=UPI002E7B388E|nr:CBM35 domain-containing protein [Streptomyces sp. NBC_01498]WTL26188.1 carbohydrate-binding protein [Streptomyces sp. NBC_01498]